MSLLHANSKVPAKALLIGINYQAWPVYNLRGCHADVADAEAFLLSVGMKSRDIKILTDKKNSLAPTKAAILQAFEWLKDGAEDGDVLYLHFSGHGVETDPPSDNPLGRASSKAICPIDVFHSNIDDISGKWKYDSLTFVNPITGEDFADVFGHFADTQINLTVVYDCCHSTGAMRAIGAPGEPAETSVRGIHVPAAERAVYKTVAKKAEELGDNEGTRGGLDKQYERRYAPAELAPSYVIGFAAAQGWEPAIDARTATGPCGAFSHYFYALLNNDAKNVNGQGIVDSVNKSLKANNYTQTPSLTTTKKLVPLFADLSKTTRAIGTNYERLSNPRSIDAESLEDEGEMIEREERKLNKQSKTPTKKPAKDHSSDEEDHHDGYTNGNGKASNGNGKASNGNGKTPTKTPSKTPVKTPSKRDIGGDAAPSETESTAVNHVQQVVNVYSQIAANPELQKLRTQERGLFDSLLQHAVPFALQAASSAVKALASGSGKRDIGADLAVQQHLPTAINFANQLVSIPEIQESRGLFDKIFSIGMPLVLNTAQTLLGANRGLENQSAADADAQRGLFDAIIGKLPSTVFNVLSDVIGGGNRDLGDGEDRGFLDILKKVAPVILNVASTAVTSLSGQRSLSFAPTDRGFFDSLKNVVSKVVSSPTVQKIGSTALNLGVQYATSALAGKRAIGEPEPSSEYTEAHVRGFFGSMLQSLTPIAMGALQGAVSAATGKRDLSVTVPQQRGIFDIVAQALPAVIQVAQQTFSQNRAVGATNEDEAQYLQRVLTSAAGPLIQAAREQVASPTPNGERGILGSLLGVLF